MHRVVTKVIRNVPNVRQMLTEYGPWHSDKARADRWADFLRGLGRYYSVNVESGGKAASSSAVNGESDNITIPPIKK